MRLFSLILVLGCFQNIASTKCEPMLDAYSKCQVEEIGAQNSLNTSGSFVAFKAVGNLSNTTDMILQNVTINIGGGYNKSNGIFTAPAAGIYLMSFTTTPNYTEFKNIETSVCTLIKLFNDQYPEGHGEDGDSIGDGHGVDVSGTDSGISEDEKYRLNFHNSENPEEKVATKAVYLKKGDAVSVRNFSRMNTYVRMSGFLMF